MSEWQPGETAPTDGSLFLALWHGHHVIVAYEDGEWWGDGIPPSEPPDYWMPLPHIPARQEGYAWGK
jgi:hypothetical protein